MDIKNGESCLFSSIYFVMLINKLNREKEQLGFPKEVFAFYYLIKNAGYQHPEELSNIFLNEIKIYKSWYSNTDQERIIKKELIKNMITYRALNIEEIAGVLKETIDKLKGAVSE